MIKVNYFGVFMCYMLLILGFNYFIIRDMKQDEKKPMKILDAFVLGILIYGVYETTNLAILKDWTMKTVMIDTLWGGIVLASTTAIVYGLHELL